MRRIVQAGFVLALAISGGLPARADEPQAIDRFIDFVSNGCVQALIDGGSVRTFAGKAQAKLAPEDFAKAFLRKETGTVFVIDDPVYPLVLAERPEGPCTVNTKFTGDLTEMIEIVEDFFAGPGGGFYPVRTFEEEAGTLGWTTHRIYLGRRQGRKLTLLFSTTPGDETVGQVMFAVAETKP